MNSTARNASFVPKSCRIAPQDSVKLGAGVLWGQAYTFAGTQNITLVGGVPQVGAAGGWVLVRDAFTATGTFDRQSKHSTYS